MTMQLATNKDLRQIDALYDALHDRLALLVNYPDWKKGVYPILETAQTAIQAEELFVLRVADEIAGTLILNHQQPVEYQTVRWGGELAKSEVIVIHTFCVHPAFRGMGVARKMLAFAQQYAIEQGAKAIRLDTAAANAPAIRLYQTVGYRRVGTVDLQLGYPYAKWYSVYELML